jgi:tetratricopeptide (TPR) repeat protein
MKATLKILLLFASLFTSAQSPFTRAVRLLHHDDIKGAAVIVDSCSAARYFMDSVHFYGGLISLRFNDVDAAGRSYKALKKNYPEFAEAPFLHGMILFNRQHYGKSIDAFNEMIATHPGHTRSYFNRALALGLTENYQLAVEDLTKCIALDPSFAHAYYSRAYWYEFMDKYAEAAADYEQSILKDPRNYDAYFGLAWCLQMQGQKEKACQTIERAIEAGSQVASEMRETFCR